MVPISFFSNFPLPLFSGNSVLLSVSMNLTTLGTSYKCSHRDAWVAQSVKCPTLDFGSGHDLVVVRSSPIWGSTLSKELLKILSPFPSAPPLLVLLLILSQKKIIT